MEMPTVASGNGGGTSRSALEDWLADAKDRLKQSRGYTFDSSAPYDAAALEESRKRIAEEKAAYDEIKTIEAALELWDQREKYGKKTYTEIENPTGIVDQAKNFYNQSMANKEAMRLEIETSEAFADYSANPTEENKQRALAMRELRDQYNTRNAELLDDEGAVLPIISKNAAGYIPQAVDQAKGLLKGGAIGGAIGAGVGTLVSPGAGTVAGAKLGAKVGGAIGSGASMYDDVKGAAIEGFMDAGVDIETATKAANQEAILSSIVEAMETGVDIATWGASKWLKLLASYGQNILSEGAEEGIQQGISIANRKRVAAGEDLSMLDLAGDTMGTLLGAAYNTIPGERAEIWDAAKEGAKTAAVVGGVQRVGGAVAQKTIEPALNKRLDGDTTTEKTNTTTAADNTPTVSETEKVQNPVKQTAMEVAEAEQTRTDGRTAAQNGVLPADDKLPAQQKKSGRNASLPNYGRYGTEAFEKIVEETGADPGEVRQKFETFYQGGLSDIPQEKVSFETDIQREAFFAGKKDYILSMDTNKQQGAKLQNKGILVDNDAARALNRRTRTQLQNLAKATGTTIIIDESLRGTNRNGYYENGEVHISPDTDRPMLVVARHEITHHLQLAAPEAYAAFRNYAIRRMNEGLMATDRTITEKMQAEYLEAEVDLDTVEGMDEVAAHFAEEILGDEKKMEAFIREVAGVEDHRNWVQKFFDAVHDFVQKIKNKGQKEAAPEDYGLTLEQFEKAEQLWKDALKAAGEQSRQKTGNALKTAENGSTMKAKYDLKEKKDGREQKAHTGNAEKTREVGENPGGKEGSHAASLEKRIERRLRERLLTQNTSAPSRIGRVENRESRGGF